MDFDDIVNTLLALGSIISITLAGVVYVIRTKASERRLRSKVASTQKAQLNLEEQLDAYKVALERSLDQVSPLRLLTKKMEDDLGADFHSVSIPIPYDNPVKLQFVISTDELNAPKLLKTAFPIYRSLGGRAFLSHKAEIHVKPSLSPDHYDRVDKRVGSNTGDGSILCQPFVTGGRCYGVAQFFRDKSKPAFGPADLNISLKHAHKIASEFALPQVYDPLPYPISIEEISFFGVLFSDINDFSKSMNAHNLMQVVKVLNEYYKSMTDVVSVNGGRVEEFVGDGVFASFNLGNSKATRDATILCAREMQERYLQLLQEWETWYLPVGRDNFHNIGVSFGDLYEGVMGGQISGRRKLIGFAINSAAHNVEVGKEFRSCIICDFDEELTKQGLTPDDGEFVERLGKIVLRIKSPEAAERV